MNKNQSGIAPSVKFIAFHLPQFHPFVENDAWWGKGFTEWINVTTSKPRYSGHYQPQIPADLGFYDLRVAETRAQQAAMAKQYGIDAFCYYHYWFGGKLLMQRPVEEILRSGEPSFPFFFCWANESWTRAWDGQDREVLIRQEYSESDDARHIEYLLEYFVDSRYLRVDNKPVIMIYRPDSIPNPKETIRSWQLAAQRAGLSGLWLIGVKSGLVSMSESQLIESGFDSIVLFEPNRDNFPSNGLSIKVFNVLRKVLPNSFYQFFKVNGSAVKRVDYAALVDKQLANGRQIRDRISPTVFPSWDNSPRRSTPTVIENHNPVHFERWLEFASKQVLEKDTSTRMVFINAWNEWAEGCHLEPDQRHGFSFLEAVRRVKSRLEGENP